MKTVIVGGVAAGAGTAARLRRLDETMGIVLLERGEHISYANCGLPYHLGGVIPDRDDLLIMPEPKFRAWFNVDVRTGNTVTAIDRGAKTVHVRRADGTEYDEPYDRLILATGARPLDLGFPGSDDPRICPLWTIPDMDRLIALAAHARRAVVVGGGFIGLEAAENLRGRGLDVTVLQHSDHVLPSIDAEMASYLAAELAEEGIDVRLNAELAGFRREGETLYAEIRGGDALPADLVLMSVGVRPNSELARDAGLTLAKSGHIAVNAQLQTSDPSIYAAGDVAEVRDPLTGGRAAIPLAGPANRQARVVANAIAGLPSEYRGSWGTSVIKVGRLTAAATGYTEARLLRAGLPYRKIYTHPASNASYYPGGAQMHLKLLFSPEDGRIYGAQAVGTKGVDKRIDVIASAMQSGRTAMDLAELELAYAPPFSSAKDPVNFLGMVVQNIQTGKSDPVYAEALPADAQGVDVREPSETARGSIPGFINIPLGTLRQRLHELDRSRPVVVSCQVGLRGYLAERILTQHGFRAHNLSGGYLTWKAVHATQRP